MFFIEEKENQYNHKQLQDEKTIYIIKLENERYFIYSSFHYSNKSQTIYLYDKNVKKMDFQIMLEAEIYYDYVKKYKPLYIIEKIVQTSMLDIDYYVKQYMLYYGYEYVRGGSYTNEILSEYQEKTLEDEFTTESNIEVPHFYSLKYIMDLYLRYPFTKDEIISKKNEIVEKYQKYKKEKENLDNMNIPFIYNFINDIEWLREICSRQIKDIDDNVIPLPITYLDKKHTNKCVDSKLRWYNKMETNEIQNKYKEILVKLKTVWKKYSEHLDISKINNIHLSSFQTHNYVNENIGFLKNPEFIFDDFIYHHHNIHLLQMQERMNKICDLFIYITNSIINILDEYTFDVSTWDFDIEWRTPRELYILDILFNSS